MRPARITPEIGPIGLGRAETNGLSPDQRFALGSQQTLDARRQGLVRIEPEEGLVAGNAVLLDGQRIGLLDRQAGHGSLGERHGRRRRRGGTRHLGRQGEHRGRLGERRNLPRRVAAIGLLVHAQARPGNDLVDRHAGLAQLLGQRKRETAIGGFRRRDDLARRGGRGDEHAGTAVDHADPWAHGFADIGVGVGMRQVEQHHLGFGRHAGERPDDIGQPDPADRNVGLAFHRRVRGDQIAVALVLKAKAGEIDDNDRIRPRLPDLRQEIGDGPAQFRLRQVGAFDGREAEVAQGLRDQPRAVERIGQWIGLIGARAQNQRDAGLGHGRRCKRAQHHRGREQSEQTTDHGGSP